MGNIAVRVEGLSKRYFIGGKQERYRTFRDTIADAVSAPVRRVADVVRGRTNSAAGHTETFWALKDVSFDIKHGEVVGIIGRNGAGKSTLLKVLSRITEPTEGRVKVNGRVGALLEVGTGFHPELTGRENVYLNGAILGMSHHDLDRKFDEIVAFAEIEKFIDTPVKHYSSGMGLRLGFSVAAHLEPEILVIDEVLAVGDVQFQKKCLGKMSDIAGEGRTVLFVSHNMGAVRHLCSRGFYLKNGCMEYISDVDAVVDYYLQDIVQVDKAADLAARTDRKDGTTFRFQRIELVDSEDKTLDFVKAGDPIEFRIEYSHTLTEQDAKRFVFSIRVDDSQGLQLFTLSTFFTNDSFDNMSSKGVLRCKLDQIPLVAGTYRVALWCGIDSKTADLIENAFDFNVEEANVYGTGRFPSRERHGIFLTTDYRWSVD